MSDTHGWSVSVAGAVLREDGAFLAIKRRDNGQWEPPGGILEPGERIYEGLVREVWEETGVAVEPKALTGVYQHIERDIIAMVFRCRVVSGTAHPTAESSATEWLTRDQIIVRMSPAFAIRLTDALTESVPVARSHDGVKLSPDPQMSFRWVF